MLKALRQVDWPVILVDNSPERLPVIADEANHYIHNPENAGIAEAQNQGIDKAIAEGAEAVLLLDQDSQLTGTFLNQLLDAYNTAAKQFEKLACIGPQVLCEFDNKQVKARASKEIYLTDNHILTRQIIASGMIINTLAYKRIGKKESALFIDGVDHEWCWRAKRHGYLVLKAANVVMPHRQGDGRHRLFGMNLPFLPHARAAGLVGLNPREIKPGPDVQSDEELLAAAGRLGISAIADRPISRGRRRDREDRVIEGPLAGAYGPWNANASEGHAP